MIEFERVLEQGRAAQRQFQDLELVAVGGTAAAAHCRHRVSLDVDLVTPHLRDRYEEVAARLEDWEGWTTARRNPPVLILGQRGGVALGLRQRRRAQPLRTLEVSGLIMPTAAETLRVKAFLLTERRATRDYVDVAALTRLLGDSAALTALGYLNLVYPAAGSQSLVSRFAEACEVPPLDLAETPLQAYKGLKAPFTDWAYVAEACRRLSRALVKLELNNVLPQTLDAGFYNYSNR